MIVNYARSQKMGFMINRAVLIVGIGNNQTNKYINSESQIYLPEPLLMRW